MTGSVILFRQPLAVRRPIGALTLVSIGALFGLVAVLVAGAELRWLVYAVVVLGFMTLALVFPHPDQLVWSVFVLSFQADVYLRLFYGRAGTRGLPIALLAVVGCIAVGAYIVSGNRHRLRPFQWGGRLALPIAAFLGTSLLALPSSTERFVGLAQLLVEAQLYFVYLLALNTVRSEEQFERTVKLLLVPLVMQSIVYFFESAFRVTYTLTGEVIPEVGVVPRPGGTVATNPAGFASFILPLVLIAVAHLVSRQRPVVKGLHAGIAAVLGIAALTLTFTRAAWVAFTLGVSWLLLLAFRRRALRLRQVLPIGVAVVGAVLIFWPMIQRRLSDSPVDLAYEERAGLMRMALRVIASQPLTGVGPGAYAYTYKTLLTPELRDQWLATVHNAYLLRTAETGIPGGIALVFLLAAGLRQAMRLTRARQRFIRITAMGWSAGLIALCWEMSWDIWRGFTYNALLWFLLGLMDAAERLAQPSTSSERVDTGQRGAYRLVAVAARRGPQMQGASVQGLDGE